MGDVLSNKVRIVMEPVQHHGNSSIQDDNTMKTRIKNK